MFNIEISAQYRYFQSIKTDFEGFKRHVWKYRQRCQIAEL